MCDNKCITEFDVELGVRLGGATPPLPPSSAPTYPPSSGYEKSPSQSHNDMGPTMSPT